MPIFHYRYSKEKGGRLELLPAGGSGAAVGSILVVITVYWLVHEGHNPTSIIFLAFAVLIPVALIDRLLGRIAKDAPVRDFVHGCAVGFMLLSGALAWALMINQLLYKLPGKYANWFAVAVLPAGYFASRFKQKNQWRYGLVEVVVGIATAFGVTVQLKGVQPPQGLTLVAAAYVVARGFNNMSDARKKAIDEHRSPLGQ